MAHEITSTDAYGEQRQGFVMIDGKQVARGRAWHGLGIELDSGLSAQEAFKQLGIDWGTNLNQCYTLLEDTTKMDGSQIRVPIDLFTQTRDDLAPDHPDKILGTVSGGYKPFDNMDVAKLADELVGADAAVTVETAGTLKGGKRVFCLVKLPHTIEATRDDVLQQYICLSSGHAGFAALSGYPTSVRVVCANTLRWSERDVARGFKLIHSGDFEDKLKMARNVLGLAVQESKKFEEQVKALVGTTMSKAQTRVWMQGVWEDCFGDPAKLVDESAQARMVEKRDATVEKWLVNLEDERQQIRGIRGTAWAAYNAVSQWHDHERGNFRPTSESDARVHSNLFGVSQDHKARVFRSALALA